MKVLSAFIKERNLKKWPELITQCAENSIAMTNTLDSSGFLLNLVDLLAKELEIRSQLYIDHVKNPNANSYDKFIQDEEAQLRQDILNRWEKTILGKEYCEIVREKYLAIISEYHENKPKDPIGFDSPG